MQLKSFYMTMKDGTEIWVNRWLPDDIENAKGVVQLHHGLEEHSLRYDAFGSVLAENGYILNAYDFRGHGKTAEKASADGKGIMGQIAKKNGSKIVVEDLDEMIESVKKEYEGLPVILFGHSFGSLVSQAYIEKYGDKLDGCVLCGTAGPMRASATIGKCFTAILNLFARDKKSKLMTSIAFGGYNNRIQEVKNGKEWLSKNELNVTLYLYDNYCGQGLTTSFYHDLATLLSRIHKRSNMKKVPKNLPVFMIYGDQDPVGSYGKTINRLYEIYNNNGMSNVEIKAYKDDRHEILNEDDRYEIMADITGWLDKVVSR